MSTNSVPSLDDSYLDFLIAKVNPTHEPIYVEVIPEPSAKANDCFFAVKEKVAKDGGRIIYGWQVWKTQNIIEAEAHAIWENPEEKLIDITPKVDMEKQILFLEDENLIYNDRQIDNIRINISNNKLIDDFILVAKGIFEFKNRGKRAELFDLSKVLNSEQLKHLYYLESLKSLIFGIMQNSGNRDTLCLCNSGKKFKNCHGKDLVKSIIKIK